MPLRTVADPTRYDPFAQSSPIHTVVHSNAMTFNAHHLLRLGCPIERVELESHLPCLLLAYITRPRKRQARAPLTCPAPCTHATALSAVWMSPCMHDLHNGDIREGRLQKDVTATERTPLAACHSTGYAEQGVRLVFALSRLQRGAETAHK